MDSLNLLLEVGSFVLEAENVRHVVNDISNAEVRAGLQLQVLIDSLLVLEAKRCELFESVAHHVDVFEQRKDLALLYDEVERLDRYFFLSSADLEPFTALLGFIHHVMKVRHVCPEDAA